MIHEVGSLLSEGDFDAGPAGFRCTLADGRQVEWGTPPGQRTESLEDIARGEMGIPPVAEWDNLSLDEKKSWVRVAQGNAEPWPLNSQVREVLAAIICKVAQAEVAGVFAAASAVGMATSVVEVATAAAVFQKAPLFNSGFVALWCPQRAHSFQNRAHPE